MKTIVNTKYGSPEVLIEATKYVETGQKTGNAVSFNDTF